MVLFSYYVLSINLCLDQENEKAYEYHPPYNSATLYLYGNIFPNSFIYFNFAGLIFILL